MPVLSSLLSSGRKATILSGSKLVVDLHMLCCALPVFKEE